MIDSTVTLQIRFCRAFARCGVQAAQLHDFIELLEWSVSLAARPRVAVPRMWKRSAPWCLMARCSHHSNRIKNPGGCRSE
jgi:hypothetical protein